MISTPDNPSAPASPDVSRRSLLKSSVPVLTAASLGTLSSRVYAADDGGEIRLALVGCGGRGTGAAANALSVPQGVTKLVALADVFPEKLERSKKTLAARFKDKAEVPEENQFIGFEGYKHAMDALRPGDVVILTTPPAFRGLHFKYAIERGLNVFMEKPVTVDGPSTRRMLALGEESKAKGMKVGVGLMCRHCVVRQELFDRIQNGEIGDLLFLRAYRMAGPTATAFSGPRPNDISELMYQISRFHSWLWLSGGAYSDFLIHNIDECCWMKNDWPVEARGSGGRHYRGNNIDQNFDTYSTEFTFADGSKLYMEGRTIPGCENQFASFAHGSKGSAIISKAGHTPARSRMHSDQTFGSKSLLWSWREKEPNPYQLEWDNLIDAIQNDKEHHEVERGAKASLVTAMGRFACHTGQKITFDEMLNHEHDMGGDLASLTLDGPSPLKAGDDGLYPIPMPGIKKDREY